MIELNVTGMTCGHCVRSVTEAVKALDPQAAVQIDLGSKRVSIDSRAAAEELIRALDAAGYPAARVASATSRAASRSTCCGCR